MCYLHTGCLDETVINSNMSRKVYKSRKDLSFILLLLLFCVVVTGFIVIKPALNNPLPDYSSLILPALIAFAFDVIMVWILLRTTYILKNDRLVVKFGPFSWQILVTEINTIRNHQKTIGAVYKPTLSWRSIELTYKSTRRIYISPKPKDEFIKSLLEINPNIIMKHG